MHHDQRQRAPVFLPMTMAQHGNAGFYFDQTFLCGCQIDSPRKKKSPERLHMPAPQPTTRTKDGRHECRRLRRHSAFELSS